MDVFRPWQEVVLGHPEMAATLGANLEQTSRAGFRRARTVHFLPYSDLFTTGRATGRLGVSMELRASASAVAFQLGW